MNLDIGIRCVIAPVLRWYYKEISNNCSQFDFQGCGGNGNNFADRETCDRTCRVSYKEQCKVTTTWNLTWKDHIAHISNKVAKNVGIFSRISYLLPHNCN